MGENTRKRTLLSRISAITASAVLALSLAGPASAATIIRDPENVEVLVNKVYPLSPLNYVPSDLVTVPGTSRQLRATTSSQLMKLFYGARSAGHYLRVTSAYRSYSYQVSLYNSYVRQYGSAYANRIAAKPGYSEHQTGLAVDVGLASGSCGLQACFGSTAAGKWVAANAYRYGFVIRYPKGYESTTGYTYEPWHLRYVGTQRALELRSLSVLTLEHYYDGVSRAIPNAAALVTVDSLNVKAAAAKFNGTWDAIPSISTTLHTASLTTQSIDWNADGVLDVLWLSPGSRVYVRLGTKTGGFTSPIIVARGFSGSDVVAAKFVSSRKLPELAVRDANGVVRKYARSGNGVLTTSYTVMRQISPTARIGAADWNHDGAQDLLALTGTSTVAYLGNGYGSVNVSPSATHYRFAKATTIRRVDGAFGPGTRGYFAEIAGNVYYFKRGASSVASGFWVGEGQLAK